MAAGFFDRNNLPDLARSAFVWDYDRIEGMVFNVVQSKTDELSLVDYFTARAGINLFCCCFTYGTIVLKV